MAVIWDILCVDWMKYSEDKYYRLRLLRLCCYIVTWPQLNTRSCGAVWSIGCLSLVLCDRTVTAARYIQVLTVGLFTGIQLVVVHQYMEYVLSLNGKRPSGLVNCRIWIPSNNVNYCKCLPEPSSVLALKRVLPE